MLLALQRRGVIRSVNCTEYCKEVVPYNLQQKCPLKGGLGTSQWLLHSHCGFDRLEVPFPWEEWEAETQCFRREPQKSSSECVRVYPHAQSWQSLHSLFEQFRKVWAGEDSRNRKESYQEKNPILNISLWQTLLHSIFKTRTIGYGSWGWTWFIRQVLIMASCYICWKQNALILHLGADFETAYNIMHAGGNLPLIFPFSLHCKAAGRLA